MSALKETKVWQGKVTDKNIGEFLEAIGFSNFCCGCSNENSYSIKHEFNAVVVMVEATDGR